MKDIDIKNEYGSFKFRVSAVIVKNNKVLLVKSKSRENGYCFAGGHVKLGETTLEAIVRECLEELKITVKETNLLTILENLYTTSKNKVAQEVNYFYEVNTDSIIPDNNFALQEIDEGIAKENSFEWIDIDNLDNIDLLPSEIKNYICNKQNNLSILIDHRSL